MPSSAAASTKARAACEPTRRELEEACRRWREAVERLPATDGLSLDALPD
ncbi:MAG TPA: hypothetical protein VH650_10230 [Gaiellaceae bacterium]